MQGGGDFHLSIRGSQNSQNRIERKGRMLSKLLRKGVTLFSCHSSLKQKKSLTPYGLHPLLPFWGHLLDCIQLWLFQRWCKKEKQEQNTSLLPPDKPDGAHWSEGAKQSGLAKGCLIDLASEWFFLKWVSDQDCFACGAHKMQGATQSRVGVWKKCWKRVVTRMFVERVEISDAQRLFFFFKMCTRLH